MTTEHLDWLRDIRAADEPVEAFTAFRRDLPAERPRIRLGVKDIIDVAGLPTECNSPIYEGHVATDSATCVTMLEAVGATVIGKTVTAEFATTHAGPTRNPLNTDHSPGGSSSGSAAAVAAGMADLAIGTQTGGSVIRPAAFCGIFGYLPSAGTVPRDGVRIMSPTLDRVGFFTRTVAEMREHMAAFAVGRDDVPDRPLRIALMPRRVWAGADPATLSALDAAIAAVRATGDEVVEPDDPAPFQAALEAQKIVQGYEIPRALETELRDHEDLLSDELSAYCRDVAGITMEAFATALDVADRFRLHATALFGACDAVLGPSAAGLAPEGIGWTGDPYVNRIWSLSKLPAVNLPSAAGATGLPAGLQLNAPLGADARLLAIAARYETPFAAIVPRT